MRSYKKRTFAAYYGTMTTTENSFFDSNGVQIRYADERQG